MNTVDHVICKKCGKDITEYIFRVASFLSPGTKSHGNLCPTQGCLATITVNNCAPVEETKSEVFLSYATEETWGTKPLNWTTEKPTVPGHYWYRDHNAPVPIKEVAWINDDMEIWFIGSEYQQDVSQSDYEWYGPLEVPK